MKVFVVFRPSPQRLKVLDTLKVFAAEAEEEAYRYRAQLSQGNHLPAVITEREVQRG